MAKQTDEPKTDVDEDDNVEAEGEGDAGSDAPMLKVGDQALATVDGAEADADAPAAAQLGTDRYVIAGFFAAGLIGAFVLGRLIEGLWNGAINKEWFASAVPFLAAIGEETRKTYSFILSGVIALVVVLRTYRRPDVRAWSDDIASELGKVVWPTKKEVYNSTFIVIVASAMATLYLALLDRLWAFVTNIVYGDGS
jgi:preprotein translocase subunit SecE